MTTFGRKRATPITEERALEKLATLCSAAEHCRQEMVDKCAAWGLPNDAAQRVADRLEADRFIDDSRFAPLFVRDKARFGGWGPIKVRMALKARRVDDDTANEAIDAFDKDEWRAILRHALEQKLKTARKDDPQKLLASLIRFATQRGFDYAAVRDALNEIWAEANTGELDP